MEADMRSIYAIAFGAFLVAAPAMGQVIIQTPNGDATRHEQQVQQDRADAHWARQEAQHRAAVGDYRGAAEADREAHRDWHDARRQDSRAQDEQGGYVVGR
jgi:hypothetical protein